MAFNAAELSVKFSVDTADLDRGLRDADAKLRQFGARAGSAGRGAAVGTDQLAQSLGGVRSALQAVGVSVGLAQIARLGADAIAAANSLERTEASVRALSGSVLRYNQVLEVARQGQLRYGGTLEENLRGLGTLVNASNRYGIELQKLDNIARRLAIVDPLQGIEGANYALKELLSNTGATATLSLRNRFELDRSVLRGIEDQSVSATEKIEILDAALTELGISNDILANRTQTTAATYDRLGAAVDNFKTSAGGLAAELGAPFAAAATELLGGTADMEAAFRSFSSALADMAGVSGSTAEAFITLNAAQLTLISNIPGAIAETDTFRVTMQMLGDQALKLPPHLVAMGEAILWVTGLKRIGSDEAGKFGAKLREIAPPAADAKVETELLAQALQLVGANGPTAQAGLIVAAGGADAVKIAAAEARAEVGSLLDLMGSLGRTSVPGASIGGTNRAAGRPQFSSVNFADRAAGAVAGSARSAGVMARASSPKIDSARVGGAQKTADKLVEIEERTAERLREIDERVAQQRIAAQRRLVAELITSANDFAVEAQSNDLDLIGATGADAERLADRERAEATARIGYVKAIEEAKQRAAEGDAELARDTYEVRQDQVRQQQQLDEEYYRRARELPAEQQEALKKEYDEATAAIAQSAEDRIGLAQAEAAARQQAIADEKAAVVAAGAEQAAALGRTGESATTAKGQVEALGGALTSLPKNVTTTVTVRTVNEGEPVSNSAPSSGGKGGAGGGGTSKPGKAGGSVAAAGGGRFVTTGPTHLVVGDNPGGRELVTVTPLSGRGQTRVSGSVIALAGGGEVDVGGAADTARDRVNQGSTPATGGGTARARRGRSQQDIDNDWARNQARILEMERRYLFERERLEEQHFWAQTEADLWRFRREREVKRQWEAQQDEIDRAQRARENELIDQLRTQAEQRTAQAVAAAERSIGDERITALQDAERRYIARGTEIVADGAAAQNDVAAFWQTVRLADTSAAFQEERQRINDEYDRRREETVDRVRQQGEEVSQEAEEAARLQAEREFQARRDALEDQQFVDQRSWERLWDRQSDLTTRALDKQLELFTTFWQKMFEAIPGGKDAWENLQKRETGGPVRAGQAYIVGERRPELFVPDTNGRILPDLAGGDAPIYIALDLRGSTGVTAAQVKTIEDAAYRAAQRALAESGRRAGKMKRTGGI